MEKLGERPGSKTRVEIEGDRGGEEADDGETATEKKELMVC